MPLVFEVAFSIAIISRIESIEGGRKGWEVGVSEEPKAGYSKHSNTNGSAVPLVGDLDWQNSQGRPGLPLESAWHPMQSY